MKSDDSTTVEAMHKVTLTLTPIMITNQNHTPATVQLIVGLGVTGLTLMEKQLIGCEVADTFDVDLSSTCWETAMSPIPLLPKTAWSNEKPQSITVTIVATQPAKPEEVIKEMAYKSGGCSGCDCGCDGH